MILTFKPINLLLELPQHMAGLGLLLNKGIRGGWCEGAIIIIIIIIIIVMLVLLFLLLLLTVLFSLTFLLKQSWSQPLMLRFSLGTTIRIMCNVPSIAVFCSECIELYYYYYYHYCY
jgi:hypothetical protein